jgi:hypothetical protein
MYSKRAGVRFLNLPSCMPCGLLVIQGRIQDFVLGGTKVGEGSGDRLRSPASPGQSPGMGLLGFEYLGNFFVNNFEAFCQCDEVY